MLMLTAVVWLMLGALVAFAALPPIPIIKRPHKSAAVERGAGAAKLIAKLAPAQPKIAAIGKRLAWNWATNADNPASNIVFLVRSNNVLLLSRHAYPVVGISTSNSFPFTVNPAQPTGFFVITASNTVTHLESP